MRRDTKIVIAVAILIIGVGVVYFAGGDKETPTAANPPVQPPAANQTPTPPSEASPMAANAPRLNAAPSVTPPAPAAERTPPTVTGTEASPPSAAAPQPQPGTPAEVATASPAERTGPLPAPAPAQPNTTIGLRETPSATQPAGTGTLPPNTTPIRPDPRTTANTGTTATGAAATTPGQARTHKIAAGDTYSALAAKYLGHAKHAKLIADANPKVDPRRLQIGQTIQIPAAPAGASSTAGSVTAPTAAGTTAARSTGSVPLTATTQPAGTTPRTTPTTAADNRSTGRTYTVQAGEGWSTLARRFLGDAGRWVELYEYNKGRVPTDFNTLPAGTTIQLPPDARTGQ